MRPMKLKPTLHRHDRGPLAILTLVVLVFIYTQFFNTYSITSKFVNHPITLTLADVQQGIVSKPRDNGRREKATFVTICENNDLWDVLAVIQELELRFNGRYHYDWVFLSEQGFTTEFRSLTSGLISGETHFGIIDREYWRFPDFIDPEKSLIARIKLDRRRVPDAMSIPDRHKTRFWFKFFANHELLKPYDYFWRIEPKAHFTCDIAYDVFKFMRKENKKYGFINGKRQNADSMDTVLNTTNKFIEKYKDSGLIPKENTFNLITTTEMGDMFAHCAYWNNFEIGDLNFFRSTAYQTYAEEMDQAGGIYYEKWSDPTLRTLAVSLFLPLENIHFFTDIGYSYANLVMCPTEFEFRIENRCSCNQKKSVMWSPKFCMHKYFVVNGLERPEGWRDNMNRGLPEY